MNLDTMQFDSSRPIPSVVDILEAEEGFGDIPDPVCRTVASDERRGSFSVEPLEPGFGVTLGNAMRRALYSSLEGYAVTAVRVEGAQHEYQTLPGMREQLVDLLLNVKDIRIRSKNTEPGHMLLSVRGPGEVSAADIQTAPDFEIVDPGLHLAFLDSEDATLNVRFEVRRGKGYVEAKDEDRSEIGLLPVDAIFTPIRRVNYTVEKIRIGPRTDLERLDIDVWTDGSMSPEDAVKNAATLLSSHFYTMYLLLSQNGTETDAVEVADGVSLKAAAMPLERLELSSRALNALKRGGIDTIGEVLALSRSDLMNIRNFGDRAYHELEEKLAEADF